MPALIEQYGLIVVALIIFAGEIGLPTLVPGEIALLIAGSQFIHSTWALIAAAIIFGIIDIISTSTIYTVARVGGNTVLRRILALINQDAACCERKLESWRLRLGGRDWIAVFVTRLIPMYRLYASMTSGLIRIRYRSFVMGAGPASMLWAGTPLTIGYIFRARIGSLTGQYSSLVQIVIMSSVAIVVVGLAMHWVRSAGHRHAGVRRLRVLISLGVILLSDARLLWLVFLGKRFIGHGILAPSVPVFTCAVGLGSVVAMALLWTVVHDLRALRQHHTAVVRITALGSVAWIALVIAMAGVNAGINAQVPALPIL
ncbi:MAG TPA: hypothetical protein VFB58_17695 [Chloroflexota bacterium]|nr:hypothetical protein [Chloroflexota bacterium]